MYRLLLASFTLAACGTDAVPPTDDPPGDPAEPVYYGQVQKILDENCIECHSADPERLAPFALTTYDAAVAAIDEGYAFGFFLMNRMMPPYFAQEDGDCHTFSNAHWLDDEELTTLVTWFNGSHLEGDPADSVPAPPPQGGLAEIDHVVDTGEPYFPDQTVSDDYRCFVVDPIGVDAFVIGAHVKPTNLELAHHAILFTLDSDEAVQDVRLRQQQAGGPYKCASGPTDAGSTFLIGWAPGNAATRFPAGTGIRVDGSRPMVVQMHYNTASDSELPDHTTIELDLADTVATPAQMMKLSAPIDLPAMNPDATATATVTLPDNVSVQLWGGMLHMHERGTGGKLEIENTDNAQCLMDLVTWNFHWQHFYWYDTPVTVEGGDTVRLTCHYDTTGDSQDVGFCEDTRCEMCIEYVYASRP